MSLEDRNVNTLGGALEDRNAHTHLRWKSLWEVFLMYQPWGGVCCQTPDHSLLNIYFQGQIQILKVFSTHGKRPRPYEWGNLIYSNCCIRTSESSITLHELPDLCLHVGLCRYSIDTLFFYLQMLLLKLGCKGALFNWLEIECL